MRGNGERTVPRMRRWTCALALAAAAAAPAASAAAATIVFVPADPPAGSHYISTGVTLAPGQQVRISAGGTAYCGNTDVCGTGTGPDGKQGTTGDQQRAEVLAEYGIDYGPFEAPSLTAFSLIGRVGTGPVLQLGSATHTVAGSGVLMLAYNDNLYSDNTGGYTVTVQRCTVVFGICLFAS